MSNWKKIIVFFTAAVLALAVTGCGNLRKLKDIQVNHVGVKYFAPTSARSVDAVLLLEIDNPAMGLTLSNVDGTVRKNGEVLGYFTAGELPLQGKSVQVYEPPCTATIADNISLVRILGLIAQMSLDGMTVDITLHVKLDNGMGRNLTFNDLALSQLTESK